MGFTDFLLTAIPTTAVSVGAAVYLTKLLLEAKLKQGVDEYLAEKAAERDYTWNARKRLYEVIGPLRFQLLLACRDLAGRIDSHWSREFFATDPRGYYGQSTLYRLLRPMAVLTLVERQIYYADFSLDKDAADLLRFAHTLRTIFCGEYLVAGHPQVNWDEQQQHVFRDTFAAAAAALIVEKEGQEPRVMRFDEFETQFAEGNALRDALDPFPRLLTGFTPKSKPLLWLRLTACGFVCRRFVARYGEALGYDARDLDVRAMLEVTEDAEIVKKLNTYVERCLTVSELRS